MKTLVKNALVAMALVTGCGEAALNAVEDAATNDIGTIGAASTAIDLRLRAIGTDRFSSLMMMADRVDVLVDGVAVPVELDGAPVELTDEEQASRIASFQLPDGAQALEFRIRVAPAGTYESVRRHGWVDARATTLTFKASADNVLEKGKAVVVLDALKSFVATSEDAVALVPHFRVRY